MATRTAVSTNIPGGVRKMTWSGLLTTDVGAGIDIGRSAKKRLPSYQALGTFGAGGSINIQGTNDGATWFTLGSIPTAGNIIAPAIVPQFVRPSVAGGDGTTNITVLLVW